MWIAFIFQYLWDTTQLIGDICNPLYCCELLSFFSIFGIQHNYFIFHLKRRIVVNCFHFSVSLGYNTTMTGLIRECDLLWIAFIFQYLWDTTQPAESTIKKRVRCELLSFFSIFGIQHNKWFCCSLVLTVVNCFHFSVSLRYNTTPPSSIHLLAALWIAFIFQYLWDTTQHHIFIPRDSHCCELLSFFSIFEIQHNFNRTFSLLITVVNCFHFSVSLRYNTTFCYTNLLN